MTSMKECKVCREAKPFDSAQKYRSKASGFHGTLCWDCYVIRDRGRSANFRATLMGYAKHRASTVKFRATLKGYASNRISSTKYAATPEGGAKHTWGSRSMWHSKPSWANDAHIVCYYQLRNIRNSLGEDCVVDHVVPIRHPLVCGLHNEFNLQVLTRKENATKSNRYTP